MPKPKEKFFEESNVLFSSTILFLGMDSREPQNRKPSVVNTSHSDEGGFTKASRHNCFLVIPFFFFSFGSYNLGSPIQVVSLSVNYPVV